MFDVFLAFGLIASATSTNKILLSTLPPIFLVGARMLFAGLILWAIACYKKTPINFKRIKSDAAILGIITLCTTFLPSILKSYALKYMPSANAAFFGTLDPFVTAFYAYLIFNEKLNWQKFLGISLGFFGAFILMFTSLNTKTFSFYPALSALIAVAIVRLGWILVQRLLRENKYTPIQINSITMLGSGILSLAASFSIESIGSISICNPINFTCLSLYTIIIGNVISLTLYATLLKSYNATLLSLASFSVPLFVALFGWLYLNEPISINFFASLLLTFIGLCIFNYDKLPRLRKATLQKQPNSQVK